MKIPKLLLGKPVLILSLAFFALFLPRGAVWAQQGQVVASVVPSNSNPDQNAAISAAINVDMSGVQAPDSLLASYQATLTWDPAVLQYTGFTPGPAPWNNPTINADNAGSGTLVFNEFVFMGQIGGLINILNANFTAIGTPGSSTTLHLVFSDLHSSSFADLLPILTVNDATVIIAGEIPAPEIDVSPLALDFGDVQVGNSASLSTTISNVGTADLQVTDISLASGSSSDFSISAAPGTPATIGPGGNATVEITYTPSGTGSDTGTLQIASNDAD